MSPIEAAGNSFHEQIRMHLEKHARFDEPRLGGNLGCCVVRLGKLGGAGRILIAMTQSVSGAELETEAKLRITRNAGLPHRTQIGSRLERGHHRGMHALDDREDFLRRRARRAH